MKKTNHNLLPVLMLALILTGMACQQPGPNKTGSEFIPGMAHSIAYEANVYTAYPLNTFEEESVKSRYELSKPRQPVAGTIPRGYTGVALAADAEEAAYQLDVLLGKDGNAIGVPLNGHVPYYYPDTDEGRARATAEIIENPFPITAEGLERGKELYAIYCAICHGDKGDGEGYLVREDGGVYPAAPKNFLLDEYVAASNGRFYHAIMYGINVMGSYADKLSYEERWQVIHWIRALQAKDRKLKYDEQENTLNPTFGTPAAWLQLTTAEVPQTEERMSTGEDQETTTQGNAH